MSTKSYKLSDVVFNRVVQIVQEAILTGVDCTDLLRQIRLTEDCTFVSADGTNVTLTLDPSYIDQVVASHQKMLADAEVLKGGSKGDA